MDWTFDDPPLYNNALHYCQVTFLYKIVDSPIVFVYSRVTY